MEQKTGISTGATRRTGGIRNVANGPTSMVGSQRCSRDARFHGNGVEVSIMEHDRPRWRFRLSTLMLLVIILALALTLVIDRWKREQEEQRFAEQQERTMKALVSGSSAKAGTFPAK